MPRSATLGHVGAALLSFFIFSHPIKPLSVFLFPSVSYFSSSLSSFSLTHHTKEHTHASHRKQTTTHDTHRDDSQKCTRRSTLKQIEMPRGQSRPLPRLHCMYAYKDIHKQNHPHPLPFLPTFSLPPLLSRSTQ